MKLHLELMRWKWRGTTRFLLDHSSSCIDEEIGKEIHMYVKIGGFSISLNSGNKFYTH